MTLFSISPLILSTFASAWFTRPSGGLDVAGYTAFLAVLTGFVHIIGAINLRVDPPDALLDPTPNIHTHNQDDAENPFEAAPLLGGIVPVKTYNRVWDILCEYDFWILAVITLLTLGPVRTQFTTFPFTYEVAV
jgi:hypothetical protein